MEKSKKAKNDVKLEDIALLITRDTGVYKELVLHILENYFITVANDVRNGNTIELEGIGSLSYSPKHKKGEAEDIKDKFYYKYCIDKVLLTADNTLIGLLNPNEDLGKTINNKVANYLKNQKTLIDKYTSRCKSFRDKYKTDSEHRTKMEICKYKK